MKVSINGKEIVIFSGATLGEIVRAYSMHSYRMVKSGYLAIFDRFGFLTEADGTALDGQRFYLKVIKKQHESPEGPEK